MGEKERQRDERQRDERQRDRETKTERNNYKS